VKPETLAIFSFLVSLIAYEFLGLLFLYAAAISSTGFGVFVTGFVTIAPVAQTCPTCHIRILDMPLHIKWHTSVART